MPNENEKIKNNELDFIISSIKMNPSSIFSKVTLNFQKKGSIKLHYSLVF